MSETFEGWMDRQGKVSPLPYRPWGREHEGSVMVEFREAPYPDGTRRAAGCSCH